MIVRQHGLEMRPFIENRLKRRNNNKSRFTVNASKGFRPSKETTKWTPKVRVLSFRDSG